MSTEQDFYSTIDGALTPEQAAEALALEAKGDTGTQPEEGGAPATTTATEEAQEGKQDAATPEATVPADGKAVILAKDGVHTIPYEKLVEAREGEKRWREQAEAAQKQLAELQEQAQARADAGQAPTKTDNMLAAAEAAISAGADVSLFGDFSEEALAAGIQKLVSQQVEARVQAALKPLQEKQQHDAVEAHYAAIYAKHPDADSIVESNEFKAWLDGQNSIARNAYLSVLNPQTGGTAQQIVEVFDAFKGASQKSSPAVTAKQAEAAKAALEGARAQPPASLSSIPGGHASATSPLDDVANMSGPEMMAATANMSPKQIEAWLNRQI